MGGQRTGGGIIVQDPEFEHNGGYEAGEESGVFYYGAGDGPLVTADEKDSYSDWLDPGEVEGIEAWDGTTLLDAGVRNFLTSHKQYANGKITEALSSVKYTDNLTATYRTKFKLGEATEQGGGLSNAVKYMLTSSKYKESHDKIQAGLDTGYTGVEEADAFNDNYDPDVVPSVGRSTKHNS